MKETEALLENTILPGANFVDLKLSECISTLNKLIEETGVDRHDLHLVLSHRVARHPVASADIPWIWNRLKNAPVSAFLKHLVRWGMLEFRTGEGTVEVGLAGDPGDEAAASANLGAKLDQIPIPIIDYDETTIEEAMDHIRSRTRELDITTLDPALKGIWIVVRRQPAQGDTPVEDRMLSWKAINLTAAEALDGITSRTGLRWEIDDFAVVVSLANSGTPREPQPKTR